MMKSIFYIMTLASIALGACTSTNKSADNGEKHMPASTGLQGEWRLDSYRIDCESTQFDATSNYKLSFNESDNTFSLSTDCNIINGEFGTSNDTIRFKSTFITEMACDNMIVEQNMLRMLNDSTAYAVCHGDTLAFTAPYIGSALFIKQEDRQHASDEQCFIGEYTDQNDGSTLQIRENTNSGPSIQISLFRLADIDNGIGTISDDTLTFTATDAADNPIKGEITLDGDTATVIFTQSTWGYIPDGSTFHFKRDTQSMIDERTSFVGTSYSGGGNGGGLAIYLTINFMTDSICYCISDFYQAFSNPVKVKGTYLVHNGIVEVICRPEGFEENPINWYFSIKDNGNKLSFNSSDKSEEGSTGTEWLILKKK